MSQRTRSNRIWIHGLTLGSTLLLATAFDGCPFPLPEEPPAEPDDGCYGDQDCADGLVCNAHEVCLPPPGCEPGEPCPAVCYGQCVEPEPEPEPDDGCYGDQDCADGLVCNAHEVCLPPPGCEPNEPCPAVCYGQCVEPEPEPEPDDGCYGDQDCADGLVCNAHEVCLPPPGCEPNEPCPAVCYGQCVEPEPEPEPEPDDGCYGDQDCADGLVCNAHEVCLPPPGCEPNEPCPAVCYGQCVEPEPDDGCYGDQDCADGLVCNAHEVCLPPPGCEPNEPCPAVCYGQCVEPASK